ncbi:hypothetical protein NDU88_004256 [Pleurodeles waltl]|uniref:Uncharacterized protein n=1 Tax=Pleurodeles waltl TaxID=8319 RepID=A0AAV7UET7_PLEWA|nr:hypothetical protein NDU88_004256 [Pleurodeles waltl]
MNAPATTRDPAPDLHWTSRPGRTPPQGHSSFLGRRRTLGAPPAICRAQALNMKEPAALRAPSSQAPTQHFRVHALGCRSLSVFRLTQSRRCLLRS